MRDFCAGIDLDPFWGRGTACTILGALLVMLAAAPVVALEPADCAMQTDPDELLLPGETLYLDQRSPAVDLGGGWVLQQYELGTHVGTQFGAKVVNCASGTGIIVVEAVQRGAGPVDRIARLSAEQAFRTAIASDAAVSLDSVRAQLSAAGANVGPDMLHSAANEACGCAAFYPELRGSKMPWTEWSRS